MSSAFMTIVLLLAILGSVDDPCEMPHEQAAEAMVEDAPSSSHVDERFDEALACYGIPSEETARRIHNLFHQKVDFHYERGEHEKAFQTIERFFDVFAEFEEPDLYFRMYQWKGFIHFSRGELDQAVKDYAQSFVYTEDAAAVERAHVAEQIAILYERLHDVASAQYFLKQAADIMDADDDESERALWIHARVLNTMSYLHITEATVGPRIDMEKVEEAAELAQEALALLEGLPPDAEHGSAHIRLAQHAQYTGNYAAAAEHLRRAEELAREFGYDHLRTSVAHNRGRLYMAMEDWKRAARAFQMTFNIAPEADYQARAEAMLSLGALAEVQGDWENAEAHYRTSIEQHALRRSILRTTQWAALDQRWKTAHRALIRILLIQKRTEEAFQVLDQASAQYLQDVRLQARVLGDASMETRTRFDELTAELATVRHALLSDTLSTDERTRLLNEQGRLLARRSDLLDLEDLAEPPSLDELQAELEGEGQVLLAYFIDEAEPTVKNTPRSHVFLLTPDTLVAQPIAATRTDLREKLEEVNPLLVGGDVSLLGRADFSLEALHELYALLVEPVDELIPQRARLVVLPDEPLYSLPFGLLATEPVSGYRYGAAPYLLREHAVAMELAPRLILEGDDSASAPELDVLAFGQANFSGRQGTLRGNAGAEWADLPAVRGELRAIEGLFRRVETAIDEEATERALLEAIGRPAVLHLASHAVVDRATPFRNAVILAADPSDTTGYFDGRLHLYKLKRAPLSAELVVLSGCDTAQGRLLPGEGMASLQYGFRMLGVQSSLATLWLVEDEAAADLMASFYSNLRAGHPKDVALQRAQLAYLDHAAGVRTSPFFWAAPVLYGTPQAIALEPRPFYQDRWLSIMAFFAAIVLLASLALRHRRR